VTTPASRATEYLLCIEYDATGDLVPNDTLGCTVYTTERAGVYSTACICPICGRYWARFIFIHMETEEQQIIYPSVDACDVHGGGSLLFADHSPFRAMAWGDEPVVYSELLARAVQRELTLPLPYYNLQYGKLWPYKRRA